MDVGEVEQKERVCSPVPKILRNVVLDLLSWSPLTGHPYEVQQKMCGRLDRRRVSRK